MPGLFNLARLALTASYFPSGRTSRSEVRMLGVSPPSTGAAPTTAL